jgi:hypothetical protein
MLAMHGCLLNYDDTAVIRDEDGGEICCNDLSLATKFSTRKKKSEQLGPVSNFTFSRSSRVQLFTIPKVTYLFRGT